jgi:hypothetical protein
MATETTMVDYLIKQSFYDYIPQMIKSYEEDAEVSNLFTESEISELTEYGNELIDNYFPMSNHGLNLRSKKDKETFNTMVTEFVTSFISMVNEAMRSMMTTILLQRAIPDDAEEE